MSYHLAQFNIARMKSKNITSVGMKSFVSQLDHINRLAEMSPGFIWRLKDDDNTAIAFNPYNDPQIIVNLSVWESFNSLKFFTYNSEHVRLMQKRKQWFQNYGNAYYALWWVSKDNIPSLLEAQKRLDYLQMNGPSPYSFNFKKVFDPSD